MSRRKKKKSRKKVKQKIRKLRRKKSRKKIKKTKILTSDELIFKVPKNGQIPHMQTKLNTKENINYQSKTMKDFGKKKEKELIG